MPRSNRSSLMNLFPAAPNVEQYSAVGSIEEARRRLTQAVRDAEGIGLLIGPPGTGKSMICCLLAEALRDDFDVVLLADTRLTTRRTLLQNIMFHLELPYHGLSEGELRLSLIDRLTRGAAAVGKEALVLIIDEAQSLPARLLEEVRMINNVVRDGASRVRTVLAGGVELDDRFAQPQLESLSQRVAARCYLHPLNRDETARYIRDALMRAGENPHVLVDEEAITAVHHACAGIPRLINQMMRQAILVAQGAKIDGTTIQQAWEGLQQLASPVVDVRPLRLSPTAHQQQTALAADPAPSIVEFGVLGDDTLPQAMPQCQANDAPPLAGVEAGAADGNTAQRNCHARFALDETAPEIAAELDRVTASLEGLAGGTLDATAADTWDEQCLPMSSQTTSERHDCCQFVLPADHAAAESCSLYSGEVETTALEPFTRMPQADLLWQTLDGSSWDEPLCGGHSEVDARQRPTAGSAASLFGDDFDQEEVIPLPLAGPATKRPLATDCDLLCEPESLLHREIVRIAAEASRVDFTDDAPAPPHRATLPLQRLFAEGRSGQSGSDIQLNDDSDLLVVEDELELGAPSRSYASVANDARTDGTEIDFKTLFTRLRQG